MHVNRSRHDSFIYVILIWNSVYALAPWSFWMFIPFIMSQDYWLVCSLLYIGLFKVVTLAYQDEITLVHLVRARCFLECQPSNYLAFSASSQLKVSDRCPSKFFYMPIIMEYNQGTLLAQYCCLLASNAFISTWFYWLCIHTTSLKIYKTINFDNSVPTYHPLNSSLISTYDSMCMSFIRLSTLLTNEVRQLFLINSPQILAIIKDSIMRRNPS